MPSGVAEPRPPPGSPLLPLVLWELAKHPGAALPAQVHFGLVCLAVCCALYQVLGRGRDQAPGAKCLHVPYGQPRPSCPVLKTLLLVLGTTTLGMTNCAPQSVL